MTGLLVYVCTTHAKAVHKLREKWNRDRDELKQQFRDALEAEKRSRLEAESTVTRLREQARRDRRAYAHMVDSLQSISEITRRVPRLGNPDGAVADTARLASHALSELSPESPAINVCLKEVVIKADGELVARRWGIWPGRDGHPDVPISETDPLDAILRKRMPYFYVADAKAAGVKCHVPDRTILALPISLEPGIHLGFVWISSELPAAFEADLILRYAIALVEVITPLFAAYSSHLSARHKTKRR